MMRNRSIHRSARKWVSLIAILGVCLAGCSNSQSVTTPEPATPEVATTEPASNYPHTVPDGTNLTKGRITSYVGLNDKQIESLERCGNTSDRVLLTFDEGSDSGDTIDEIATWMSERDYGAIFFPLTSQMSSERTAALRQEGFWVGNHSKTHPDLSALPIPGIQFEIAGGVDSTLFRPPYGALAPNSDGVVVFDNDALAAAHAEGARVCLWSVDSVDYDTSMSAQDITDRIAERVQPGDVILLHSKLGTNALQALPLIEAMLQQKGLELCSLPDGPTTREIPEQLPCE